MASSLKARLAQFPGLSSISSLIQVQSWLDWTFTINSNGKVAIGLTSDGLRVTSRYIFLLFPNV